MACRYAFYVGSDYKDGGTLKSYLSRSFITSSLQPFYTTAQQACLLCGLIFLFYETLKKEFAYSKLR